MLLSQLEYFRVIAQHEHMGKAAEVLCVSQPALSATVSKLEKRLGVSLFERQGRNIALNEAGKRLLQSAEFIQEQLSEMEAALQLEEELAENKLSLAVYNDTLLNGWLQEFVMQHPKLRLQQRILNEEQMAEALLDETIDIALGVFDEVPAGIVCKPLVEDEYVIAFSDEHPLAGKALIYFDDIRNAEIATLPSNATSKIANRVFAKKGCKPNVVFEGNQWLVPRNRNIIVFSSRQMIYIVQYFGKEHIRETTSQQYTISKTIADVDCKCKVSLCWKAGRTLPKMVQIFIDSLEKSYPKYTEDEQHLQSYQMMLSDANNAIV